MITILGNESFPVSNRTKKKRGQSPDGYTTCRHCSEPLLLTAAHRSNGYMHGACFKALGAEYYAKRKARDELEDDGALPVSREIFAFDISTLKSPFDVLDMIGDFKRS